MKIHTAIVALTMAILMPHGASAAVLPARCEPAARQARCGYVRVPLNRNSPGTGTIRIFFERYGARAATAGGTIVALEGGPGYPTTGSRTAYIDLYRPLFATHQLVLIDLRGTGRSAALRCKAFAVAADHYRARAGRCARQLGPRRNAFGTGESAEDIESVLSALDAGQVDLYGDSYGTYAAQTFAYRHPERLRSLTLDASYPLPGTDPFLRDIIQADRHALRLACSRRPTCARTGRDPVSALARLVAHVRSKPITTTAPNGDGTEQAVRIDEASLVEMVLATAYTTQITRDLPAALASERAGDARPLARLIAEAQGGASDPSSPRDYSEALYVAITCHDYPQAWDVRLPLAARARQLAASRRTLPAAAFSPFSADAWTADSYEGVPSCLDWPVPTGEPLLPPDPVAPLVPTLVLSGDLDTITPQPEGRVVAGRFPNSTFVDVHNAVHVTALSDSEDCSSRIARRFVRTLAAGDTSCAGRSAEVRITERFPLALGDVSAPAPIGSDHSTVSARRLAAALALTVGDAQSRWQVNYSGTIAGLRGGTISAEGDRLVRFTLRRSEFVPGIPVSGSVTWNRTRGTLHGRVTTPLDPSPLALGWSMHGPLRRAWLTGLTGVQATMLAP